MARCLPYGREGLINVVNKLHETPLHETCGCSCVAGVKLLLRWGADESKLDENGDKAADWVGAWEQVDDVDEGEDSNKQRKNDDQHIRHMLKRAPADRSWRHRGWLALCRSYPTRVQLLAKDSSSGGSSAKVAKAGCNLRRGCDETGGQAVGIAHLVGRVVGLEVEGVFRLVVGFL